MNRGSPPKMLECEKLAAVKGQSQICGEFLAWLNSRGIQLAEFVKDDTVIFPHDRLVLAQTSRDQLLAEFFEIDMDAVEREKRALLEHVRESAPVEVEEDDVE